MNKMSVHQLLEENNIFRMCCICRLKKKRKRSTSSSSSSTSSSENTSSSSSSSARRRSKKKKKKKHRSERGSKRHRRISSRESGRSAEGKSKKERKEEEEELEWYPAPPNTSATFLNQRGGPGFGVRDEEEAEEKDAAEGRISCLYSLPGVSDEDVSNSSHKSRKEREGEMGKMRAGKNRSSQSPGSREWSDRSKERGKDRRDSNSRRRSSFDGDRKRRESCSSTEYDYSRRSSVKSEHFLNSAPKQVEGRMRHDMSKRNSLDGGRYESRGQDEIQEAESSTRDKSERKCRVEEKGGKSEGGNGTRSDVSRGHEQRGSSPVSEGRPKKDLPANLLDIFNQIAQFEKEKGVRPKQCI